MTETVAARLTPPGTGAIATIAIRGPSSWAIVRRLFRPHSRAGRELPETPEAGQVWPGRCGTDVADEVVLAIKAVEPSPWVEIYCHGGKQVVCLLLDAIAAEGADRRPWEDFQRLTASHPLQALAAAVLAQAPTTRTAAILLDQYNGAFAKAVRAALDVAEASRRLADLSRRARSDGT